MCSSKWERELNDVASIHDDVGPATTIRRTARGKKRKPVKPSSTDTDSIGDRFPLSNHAWNGVDYADDGPAFDSEKLMVLLANLQPCRGPPIQPCGAVEELYEKLGRIDEGTYGIVYRARHIPTGDLVALKKLKFDPKQEGEGFPVTSLREITTLMLAHHSNIIHIRDVVTGQDASQVFMVMDFVEHDLRQLMEAMPQRFVQGEVKALMLQLLWAVEHLHSHWLVHRDIKTSNLLIANRGELKLADFGLCRKFGSPLGPMTQLVVTLWYRAPELLLGEKAYSTAVDIWSVGCVFAELVLHEPLVPGTSELDQISKIFSLLGTPTEVQWPAYHKLPHTRRFQFANYPPGKLREKLRPLMTEKGFQLLESLLTYDPTRRITSKEALAHPYFFEDPKPTPPTDFQQVTLKTNHDRKRHASPAAPVTKRDMADEEGEETHLDAGLFDQDASVTDYGFRIKG